MGQACSAPEPGSCTPQPCEASEFDSDADLAPRGHPAAKVAAAEITRFHLEHGSSPPGTRPFVVLVGGSIVAGAIHYPDTISRAARVLISVNERRCCGWVQRFPGEPAQRAGLRRADVSCSQQCPCSSAARVQGPGAPGEHRQRVNSNPCPPISTAARRGPNSRS